MIEFAPLGEISEKHFDKIYDIDVKGLLFTEQKSLPIFQDGGSIILMASIGVSKGPADLSIYHTAQAAVRSFARSWTLNWNQRNIRVNAISPGLSRIPSRRIFDKRLATISNDIKKRITTMGKLLVHDKIISPSVLSTDSTLIKTKGYE